HTPGFLLRMAEGHVRYHGRQRSLQAAALILQPTREGFRSGSAWSRSVLKEKQISAKPMEVAMKKIILPIAIAACALAAQFAPAAPPPDVKEIISKPLTDIPGKEG